MELLAYSLMNFWYLVKRGVRQYPIIKSLAYLILVATKRVGVDSISNLLTMVWDDVDGKEFPEQIRKVILQPVIRVLSHELVEVCSRNCRRVCTVGFELTDKEVDGYWNRLTLKDTEEEGEEVEYILTIEDSVKPCVVGFPVGKDAGCPLRNTEKPEEDIGSFLEIVNKVMAFRSNES